MDEYHKVGTTFRTAFVYLRGSSAQTGLTSADFTIQLDKNGTGNQSTTGVTLAEEDATNNAGVYTITVSGTTGFVSATGAYNLVVFRTAVPSERWSLTVRVTSDGTGAGSWGDASFTATASNGRIMSGGSPLSAATVRILTSANVLYLQTTSDSSGLWGPVFFNASGTYTINVSKAGYTIATGTVTVSGSTATGPGADLTLTASSTTSGLLASALWAYARKQYRDRSGAKADLEIMDAVNDALEMVSLAKKWPRYHTFGSISTVAAYSTGTIAINSGAAVVTLTGGTWPSWAASGEIYIDGQWYTIESRDSGTQLTLDDAFVEASVSGGSYVLAQTAYSLPSDLQILDQWLPVKTWPWGAQPVSMGALQCEKSIWQTGQARPYLFAVGGSAQLHVWPYPTEAHSINLLYYRRPASLAAANDTADWDDQHIVLLRRAIDYQVALRGDCVAGKPEECYGAYLLALEAAFSADKTVANRTLGYVRRDPARPFAGSTITG